MAKAKTLNLPALEPIAVTEVLLAFFSPPSSSKRGHEIASDNDG